MSRAGGSTSREYHRRRAKDHERRRANLRVSLTLVLLTPFVVYGFVVFLAIPQVNRSFGKGLDKLATSTSTTSPGAPPAPARPATKTKVVDDTTARWLGMVLAFGATLRMGREAWGARATTEAWRKGSEGEIRTGRSLDQLQDRGYAALHDRQIPGSRANIDHVVLGPTGVYVVETKHYTGRVIINGDTVKYNGRSLESAVDEVWREAAAVEGALRQELGSRGVRVLPIICIQGATIEIQGWRSSAVVRGVRFCSGRRLREAVTEGAAVLDPTDIAKFATLLESRLRSAVPSGPSNPPTAVAPAERCSCGGRMVLRHRHSDGAPFWGCDRFPKCRRIVPL